MGVLRAARGPMLVAAWAFFPAVQVVPDPADGRFAFGLAFGSGTYEAVSRNCSGDLLDAERVEYGTVGADLRYASPEGPAVEVAAGRITDAGVGRTFAGLAAVIEGEGTGFGFGLARWGDQAVPSLMLRRGQLDRPHFVTDLFRPRADPGVTGLFRAGVVLPGPRVSGTVGVSSGRSTADGDEWGIGPFAELSVLTQSPIRIVAAGSWHLSERERDAAFSIGVRYAPGGTRERQR